MLRHIRRALSDHQLRHRPAQDELDLYPYSSSSSSHRAISPYSVYGQPGSTHHSATDVGERRDVVRSLSLLYEADDSHGAFRTRVDELVRRELESQWRVLRRSRSTRGMFSRPRREFGLDTDGSMERRDALGTGGSDMNGTLSVGRVSSRVWDQWEDGERRGERRQDWAYSYPGASDHASEETLPPYEYQEESPGPWQTVSLAPSLDRPAREEINEGEAYRALPSYHSFGYPPMVPSRIPSPRERTSIPSYPSERDYRTTTANTSTSSTDDEPLSPYRPPTPWNRDPLEDGSRSSLREGSDESDGSYASSCFAPGSDARSVTRSTGSLHISPLSSASNSSASTPDPASPTIPITDFPHFYPNILTSTSSDTSLHDVFVNHRSSVSSISSGGSSRVSMLLGDMAAPESLKGSSCRSSTTSSGVVSSQQSSTLSLDELLVALAKSKVKLASNVQFG